MARKGSGDQEGACHLLLGWSPHATEFESESRAYSGTCHKSQGNCKIDLRRDSNNMILMSLGFVRTIRQLNYCIW